MKTTFKKDSAIRFARKPRFPRWLGASPVRPLPPGDAIGVSKLTVAEREKKKAEEDGGK